MNYKEKKRGDGISGTEILVQVRALAYVLWAPRDAAPPGSGPADAPTPRDDVCGIAHQLGRRGTGSQLLPILHHVSPEERLL